MGVDGFRFRLITFGSRFRTAADQSTTASGICPPTGLSEEVPFFQVREHLNQRPAGVVEDSGTHSGLARTASPERTSIAAEVVVRRGRDRRFALPYVTLPTSCNMPTTPRLMTRGPLDRPPVTGIIDGAGQFRRSPCWTARKTHGLCPASPPAGHGALMDETLQSGGLDHQSPRS